MGKVMDEGITPSQAKFMAEQPLFMVATAANDNKNGHINVSPKSPGTAVQVLDPFTVAFVDLSGSGSETAAHVLQNGRITLLFVNLDPKSPPRMLRLHGTAYIVLPSSPVATESGLIHCFPTSLTIENPGFRAIFVIRLHRVSTSCGYSMPKMQLIGYRKTLDEFITKTESTGYTYQGQVVLPHGAAGYRQLKNSFSIDGLPSIAQLDNAAVPVRPIATDGYYYAEPISNNNTSSDNNSNNTDNNNVRPDADSEKQKARELMKQAKESPYILHDASISVESSSASSSEANGAAPFDLAALVAKNKVKLPLLAPPLGLAPNEQGGTIDLFQNKITLFMIAVMTFFMGGAFGYYFGSRSYAAANEVCLTVAA